ncbi:MAG TPA: hypothetical protein VGW74_09635 [Propionibacteriaceae bacterium]|nr:hypothetical protein [Propionibacteriaceae bacterium]
MGYTEPDRNPWVEHVREDQADRHARLTAAARRSIAAILAEREQHQAAQPARWGHGHRPGPPHRRARARHERRRRGPGRAGPGHDRQRPGDGHAAGARAGPPANPVAV